MCLLKKLLNGACLKRADNLKRRDTLYNGVIKGACHV
jgi:hypothetical protein